ncbi:MAG: GNAT family N-acetyltransferase [Flavobacteriia bacterium]|jgi:RimJ/RimL family protein N-acetyltransferase
MNFNENYTLENEKVLLRPILESDYEHLLPFSLNEPELWKFSLVQANGEENLKKYIQAAIQNRINEKEYPFIVFDKIKHKYAGCTRFYDVQTSQLTTQLGFTWYGKDFQGTGLNKNCKYLMLEFAFEKLNFERIEFRADNRNQRSINAMKSIGCIEEGILRNNGFDPVGERRDSIVLSILKQEWFENVKENLRSKL